MCFHITTGSSTEEMRIKDGRNVERQKLGNAFSRNAFFNHRDSRSLYHV
uniref:Uncharacterized protein n=1 Tax=Arundo donax TaxID=35708 RepID=A0A0A9GS44_ARUDO